MGVRIVQFFFKDHYTLRILRRPKVELGQGSTGTNDTLGVTPGNGRETRSGL